VTHHSYSIESLGLRKIRSGRWNWNQLGKQTPLLIFGGVGMNMEAMAPLAEAMSERPVLMIDMPGIGGSPEPSVPYTPQMAASWGAELLSIYGIRHADVMGFSWGGAIAQQFAIQHRTLLRKLVLAAIGPGLPILPGKASYMAQLGDSLWFQDLGSDAFPGPHTDAERELISSDFRQRMTPPGTRGYLYQVIALAGWSSALALPLINRPALVLMGDKDPIIPLANGRLLSAMLPQIKTRFSSICGIFLKVTLKNANAQHKRQTKIRGNWNATSGDYRFWPRRILHCGSRAKAMGR
jgi:pimeloyl-ACP methyl ester carboxylesterase